MLRSAAVTAGLDLELPNLKERIKRILIDRLRLELEPAEIGDSMPLFGAGLGLDSIDALELVLGLEQEFDVKIEDEEMGAKALASVEALAGFVQAKHLAAQRAG
jgi:acyl carrier protein